MQTIKEAAVFLATQRVAVTGVSRNHKGDHGSDTVHRRLRDRGYDAFAVNHRVMRIVYASHVPKQV